MSENVVEISPVFNYYEYMLPIFEDTTHYVTIPAGRRCFARDTLVKTRQGYKKIQHIKKTDEVLSFNTTTRETEWKKIVRKHMFAGGHKAKPMITFKSKRFSFKCTYDHEIYTQAEDGKQAGFLPAFIVAWGDMETNQRDRLKVLCKQPRQDIDSQLQMYGFGQDNEACFRPEWIFKDNDKSGGQIQDDKASQNNSSDISRGNGRYGDKPQKFQKNRQQSTESGMGQQEGKCSTHDGQWDASPQLGGKMRDTHSQRVSGIRNTQKGETLQEQERSCETTIKAIRCFRRCNRGHPVREVLEVLVGSGEVTYDLEVEGNHNYCVTKENIVVHNSGKTYNSAMWLCEELMLNDGMGGLWIDTTQGNIEKYVERYFRVILREVFEYCHWDPRRKILRFPNKSYVDFGSAEKPQNLEGFGYKRAVINEGGLVLRKSGLWYSSVQPMVKDEDCQVKIIGTPRGKNTFHELFISGREGHPEYSSYHFTAYDSPNWRESELEMLKAKVPELIFSQEYMAEFLEGEGMVFRNIKGAIKKNMPDKPIDGHSYVLGVDLAKHVDFTVITVMDQTTREIVYMDRFNEINWVVQKRRIQAAALRWNNGRIILDSTGNGDSIYDDLVAMGLKVTPVTFTNALKQELVMNLSIAIENQEIWLPDNEMLIDELAIFECEYTPSGNVRYNAPEGFHDDIVISLCLALHGSRRARDILIGTF